MPIRQFFDNILDCSKSAFTSKQQNTCTALSTIVDTTIYDRNVSDFKNSVAGFDDDIRKAIAETKIKRSI